MDNVIEELPLFKTLKKCKVCGQEVEELIPYSHKFKSGGIYSRCSQCHERKAVEIKPIKEWVLSLRKSGYSKSNVISESFHHRHLIVCLGGVYITFGEWIKSPFAY